MPLALDCRHRPCRLMAAAPAGSADWLRQLFAAVDASDATRFSDFLAPDAVFRFGAAPAVQGRQEITTAVAGFFSSIAGCNHRLARTWSGDGTLACEGEVTYRRHDGSEITLPFVNVFELSDNLISGYRIYIDIGPLYAA